MSTIIKEEVVEQEDINLGQRVRLFKLSEDGNSWRDRGIGQISVYYVEHSNDTYLLVHAETDGTLLLENKIQQHTTFRKQQERFIVWSDDDNQVFGLSFQVNDACNDIWKAICQVQGKIPYEEIPQGIVKAENIKKEEIETVIKEEVKDETEEVKVEGEADELTRELWFEEMLDLEHLVLSTYEKDVLGQLIDIVNRMVSPAIEDRVPSPAERKLLDLFHITEDIEETERLEQMHKTILYLLSTRDRQ